MKKKSMDDPIKRTWRHKEYKFIKNHRESLGEPKDWMVAFLPGAGAGLYPTELEMLEKLGAKRSNMVGIEKNKNVYNKLKSRKLGINLEWADTEDFFKNINQKFDIVSLDYSGQFSHQVTNTLRYISGRQLLNNRAILTTNLYGRMESSDAKASYYGGIFASQQALCKIVDVDSIRNRIQNRIRLSMGILPKKEYEQEKKLENKPLRGMEEFFKEIGYDNLEKLRDRGITPYIISILMKGKELFEINPIYLRNPYFKDIEKHLLNLYDHLIKDAKSKDQNYDLGLEGLDELFIHMNPIGTFHHDTNLSLYLFNKGFPWEVGYFALFDFSCPYFPEDLESYWYRSERGSPMYSDFFYVNQHKELIEKYHEFNEKIYRDLKDGPFTKENILTAFRLGLKPKDLKELLNEYDKDFSKLQMLVDRIKDENLPERIFLGSSSKRSGLDGKTYYKHRLNAIEKGQDSKELWEQLKEKFKTSTGQLRAYERHFNMETYGPKEVEKPVQKKNYDSRSYKVIDLFKCSNPAHYLENGLLPEGAGERLHHFLEEDLPFRIEMGKEEKNQLVNNIAETNWYKRVKKNLEEINNIRDYKEREGKREALEKQLYTFFDDIMLYSIWNEKVPDKEKIKGLLHDSLQGGKILPERPKKPDYIPETKKGGEEMSPKGRPYISKEAALALLRIGHEPQEIAGSYRGFTAGQLRAFKAHTTMNTYGDGELTDNLAYELFSRCGLETSEVATAFPKESRHRIGAYKAWVTMRKRGK